MTAAVTTEIHVVQRITKLTSTTTRKERQHGDDDGDDRYPKMPTPTPDHLDYYVLTNNVVNYDVAVKK